MHRNHVARGAAVAGLLSVLLCAQGFAQHSSELTARDKAEIFIQHLVKILKLEPAKYRALVLEYEIGSALAELSEDVGKEVFASADFIDSSLKELFPDYARAAALTLETKDSEARVLVKGLLGSTSPYLAAYAGLLAAEMDLRSGETSSVLERCETLARDHRQHLIQDHRAAELIALTYRKLDKPVLEFAEYAILLTDYVDLPPAVKSRVEARLKELEETVGQPLKVVAGWMNHVEKLLAQDVTADDPTQSTEREVVTALDKLIELQEAIERNACGNCGGNCKGGACKSGAPKGNRSQQPAQFSRLPPRGEGAVSLHGVSRADPGSIWGLLEHKDAGKALDAFRGKLPARYEKLLEQYYKALAKDDE